MPDARPAFVFDGGRCTGCAACQVACGIENAAGGDPGWRRILTLNPSRHPALPTVHLSLACNHCDTPECLLACPAAAYRRDAATGAVLLDETKCLGCRYCSWVCPFDAPRFDAARGVMTKCTFCAPRLAAGGEPACTAGCPTGALTLGVHVAGEPEPSGPGLAPSGLGPALRLVPPRRPAFSAAAAGDEDEPSRPLQPLPPRKIRLAAEWPLVAFTVLLPALVAWLAAAGSPLALQPDRSPPTALVLGAGLACLALAGLHLGRPFRAWRALHNLGSSWLSREVLCANLFLGAVALGGLTAAESSAARLAGAIALAAGAGLLLSIDRVYRAVPRPAPRRTHPAEATLAGFFLFTLLAGILPLAVALGTARALLLVRTARRGDWGLSPPWAALRLALLTLACALSFAWPLAWPLAFAVALIGEAIDRTAFFAALEPTSPAREMAGRVTLAAAPPRS